MRSIRERFSIQAAVLLGFGLIFALWVFPSMQIRSKIAAAHDRAAAINVGYVKGQQTLADIRTQVLMASVAFRDALLDRDVSNMDLYRGQLDRL